MSNRELKPGEKVYYLREVNCHSGERSACKKAVYEVLWTTDRRVTCRVVGVDGARAKSFQRHHLVPVGDVK
jgi:hypothetical protein